MRKLVKCLYPHWEFVRQLRNDQRHGFVSQEEIAQEEHHEFMLSAAHQYRVLLLDGVPAGFVGVHALDVRIAVSDACQGKGLAKYMLSEMLREEWFSICDAKVKIDNLASKALFESCGYTIVDEKDGFHFFRYHGT